MSRFLYLALGVLISVLSTAAPATADQSTLSSDTYEKRVRYWINVQREAHDLKPLKKEDCTDRIAQSWGQHLAESGQFYHQSMSNVIHTCDATYAGETLAKGAVRPRQIVKLWMSSPVTGRSC